METKMIIAAVLSSLCITATDATGQVRLGLVPDNQHVTIDAVTPDGEKGNKGIYMWDKTIKSQG